MEINYVTTETMLIDDIQGVEKCVRIYIIAYNATIDIITDLHKRGRLVTHR
jgi:hypothetical protein